MEWAKKHCCRTKRPVSRPDTGRFIRQNGPFGNAKRSPARNSRQARLLRARHTPATKDTQKFTNRPAFYALTSVFLRIDCHNRLTIIRFLQITAIFANVQRKLNAALKAAAVALASTLALACTDSNGDHRVLLPTGIELKPGDVVLRRGNGMASRAVLMADGGGAYSHVGIVVDSAGVLMVAHAVPGEPDYEGDPDRVKLEPPERYYDAGRADRGCVMRCADSLTAQRAAAKALGAYRRGALFDHDYDCSDTVRLYCCELVEMAYAGAGMPIATLPRHNLSLPGLRLEGVILPSDFRSSPVLRVIAEF